MAGETTHTGSCHCGAVRYEVTFAPGEPKQAVSCNCSRCSRLGWLIAFVGSDQFKLASGEDALSDYRFNTHKLEHLFCATCGIESFARGVAPNGAPTVCINLRCLEDFDVESVPVTKFDGRSR